MCSLKYGEGSFLPRMQFGMQQQNVFAFLPSLLLVHSKSARCRPVALLKSEVQLSCYNERVKYFLTLILD